MWLANSIIMQTAALSEIETLVELHYRSLFCFAERLCPNPAEAMLLTQRTLLLALDRSRDLPVPANVRAWLLSILFHEFLETRARIRGASSAASGIACWPTPPRPRCHARLRRVRGTGHFSHVALRRESRF